MKLDSRILEGKKPLTCFDAENRDLMKSFLNKEGYFSNTLKNFCFLNKCTKRCLSNVFSQLDKCFTTYVERGGSEDWRYFLPAEWVKEPEKKYRAFTIKEFKQKYSVGSVLKIRQKQNRFTESVVQYTGYKVYEERVYLGITDFTLDELFENFEMIEPQNDTWQPFGIIDD